MAQRYPGFLLMYCKRLLISHRILFCWCRRVRLFIFVALQCKTLKLEPWLFCAYFKLSLVVLLTVIVCPVVLPLNPFLLVIMQSCALTHSCKNRAGLPASWSSRKNSPCCSLSGAPWECPLKSQMLLWSPLLCPQRATIHQGWLQKEQ